MLKFTKVHPDSQIVKGKLCCSPPIPNSVSGNRIEIVFFPDEPVLGPNRHGDITWVKRGDWTWTEDEFEATFGVCCPLSPGDTAECELDLGNGRVLRNDA